MSKTEDEGIRAVREVRERISAEFENDPDKLVAHYIEQQQRHRDRLLQSVTARETDAKDPTST